MKREEVKKEVLAYLGDFFSTFILYDELPVKQKLHSTFWAYEMYDKLTDKERVAIYLKQNKKTWKEE
jgi:hypothetical protein